MLVLLSRVTYFEELRDRMKEIHKKKHPEDFGIHLFNNFIPYMWIRLKIESRTQYTKEHKKRKTNPNEAFFIQLATRSTNPFVFWSHYRFKSEGGRFALYRVLDSTRAQYVTHYICSTGTLNVFEKQKEHGVLEWNLSSIFSFFQVFNYRSFWNSTCCGVGGAGANSSKAMRKTVKLEFPSNYLILTYMELVLAMTAALSV